MDVPPIMLGFFEVLLKQADEEIKDNAVYTIIIGHKIDLFQHALFAYCT
jgi:hypothetical protein